MADCLHIDFVTETYAPEVNGVAMTLGRLVDGLQATGASVNVFRPRQTADEQARRNGRFSEQLLPGMRLPMYRDLRLGFPATRSFTKAWENKRPDALYIATQGPLGWSAVRTAEQLGIPALSGFHTNFHTYSQHYRAGFLEPLILSYLRRFHRRTRCTLAPTHALANQLHEKGFGRVEVLQRGVDTQLFSPQHRSPVLRRQWIANETGLVCLYVGRIAAEKNIAKAVSAFRAIQQHRPDARFVLVGDGPLRETLRRENPDFVFCGTRRGEELAQHYASGDIFLFPSRTETFGNVVTEAMASGLAVVAYNEAAAQEHIRLWNTGVLAGDPSLPSFEKAALDLSRNPDRVREIGAEAARYAQTLDWSGVVQRFSALIEEQIAGDPP